MWFFRCVIVLVLFFVGFVWWDCKRDSTLDNNMMMRQWVVMEQMADMQVRILHHVDQHENEEPHIYCPECGPDKLKGKTLQELEKHYTDKQIETLRKSIDGSKSDSTH